MRYLLVLAFVACGAPTAPDLPPCDSFEPAVVVTLGGRSAVVLVRVSGPGTYDRGNPPYGQYGQLMRQNPQGDFFWLFDEPILCH